MVKSVVWCITLTLIVAVSAGDAQIPPGYEVVKITDDPEEDRYARMNNCGEVVFYRALPAEDRTAIFLYDNGRTRQVSGDARYTAFPDINDDGVIVWSQWDEPNAPPEIVIYEDGVITELTDHPADDRGPRINNLGHVTWKRWFGGGCGDARADIMFYDGTMIVQLTDNGYSNQSAWINDHDEIVWTRYDFCASPWWESEIMLWVDGVTTQITSGQLQTQVPAINNARQVVWGGLDGIDVWQPDVTTHLTDWGHVPSINDHGEIFFHRWHEDEETRHVWWYRDGTFYQLTDDPISNTAREINEYGEAVWWILEPDHRDVGMMRRVRNGDVDFDFDVNGDDFAPFPACLTGPLKTDHLCACRFFDIDHDRDVDLPDFAAFQNLFTGGN